MRTLRVGFAVMLATAAVVPLLTYGALSVYSLREGTRRSVVDGNLNVARQVGEQVRRYIATNLQILEAVAADFNHTNLSAEQQDRILKNYALRFPAFRELSTFDAAGKPAATSRVGRPGVTLPTGDVPTVYGVRMSPVVVDGDLLPTAIVAAPLGHQQQQEGWLVAEFSIEELWRLVGRIHVGSGGFVLVVGPGGELLAHGNPEERERVARGTNLSGNEMVVALRAGSADEPVVREIPGKTGERVLAVGVRIPELNWMVIVEQPSREAFAVARRHERDLIAAISLALLIMVLTGLLWGRSLIRPITALIHGTEAIAEGRLDQRVVVESKSEIGKLGEAFNSMADRLVELQDDVRKQERHAMFGRIAAGLVHDLSHPFKNVQNNCRLMLKMHDDAEYRELFRRTIDREFAHIKRVFEDLRSLARPMPIERFPLDLNRLLTDVAESMRGLVETAGLSLDLDLDDQGAFVEGDVFALSRVTRNLVLNAIEATPPNGTVTMATEAAGGSCRLRVSDTGCGIPPDRIGTLFEDFTTTKRQGLGLGLAISKKIVDQLGGTISATSAVGQGTTFVVELTRVPPPPAAN
ncbi:MAG: sensor histidine kinase [Acidobacteria bacterium]|nr:sensor histidine kinase [Acidobacteriota bacterium]